jgi:drug/metabolite transporter (DMT)-like permease
LAIATLLTGIKLPGAPTASVLFTLQPIVPIGRFLFVLQQLIPPLQLIGGAFILVSVIVFATQKSDRTKFPSVPDFN